MKNINTIGQTSDLETVKVEVLDFSTVDLKLKLDNFSDGIFQSIQSISNSFISIGNRLSEVKNTDGLLKANGFDDIYEYAEVTFGFKKTSTKNFINVADRFGDGYRLKKEFEEYNFSQLIELLPEDDMSSFSPYQTILEMRDVKKCNKCVRDGIASLLNYMETSFRAFLGGFEDLKSISIRTTSDGGNDCNSPTLSFEGYYKERENYVEFEIRYEPLNWQGDKSDRPFIYYGETSNSFLDDSFDSLLSLFKELKEEILLDYESKENLKGAKELELISFKKTRKLHESYLDVMSRLVNLLKSNDEEKITREFADIVFFNDYDAYPIFLPLFNRDFVLVTSLSFHWKFLEFVRKILANDYYFPNFQLLIYIDKENEESFTYFLDVKDGKLTSNSSIFASIPFEKFIIAAKDSVAALTEKIDVLSGELGLSEDEVSFGN